jgi:fucose permease
MEGRRLGTLLLLGLSCLGFVSLGLPDGLLGVAWPSIRRYFALPLDALGALLVTTTAGYVLSSFASGRILARMSVGTLLALSCLATAASMLGYAAAPSWVTIVVLGSIAGLGAGAIDAGINTYVAANHSPRALSLLHAFYGLGTTTGPLIMTSVLMASLPWQRGYAIVGMAQLALAFFFGLTRAYWPRSGPSGPAHGAADPHSPRSTLRLPAAQLGIVAFLLYVGIEASAGAWVYTLFSEGRSMSMRTAGTSVSVFWAGLMLGRILFGLFPGPVRLPVVLRLCTAAMVIASSLIALDLGEATSLLGVAMLGCSGGPVFPALIAATPRRLGEGHAANAIGFQVAAAALGQSLLPAGVGVLAHDLGLEALPLALLGAAVMLVAACELLARLAPIRDGVADGSSDVRGQSPRSSSRSHSVSARRRPIVACSTLGTKPER